MFVLSIIEDLVRVHPSQFIQLTIPALTQELNKKYSNKIIDGVGLGIKVNQIITSTDLIVHACQDGSYQSKVSFSLIVFRPLKDEVILGTIKSSHPTKGIRVSINFFDDIYIPPVYMKSNTSFDTGEGVWVWHFDQNQLFMDDGNWIRIRIEQLQFMDIGPNTSNIPAEENGDEKIAFIVHASCSDFGLGLLDWWQ